MCALTHSIQFRRCEIIRIAHIELIANIEPNHSRIAVFDTIASADPYLVLVLKFYIQIKLRRYRRTGYILKHDGRNSIHILIQQKSNPPGSENMREQFKSI